MLKNLGINFLNIINSYYVFLVPKRFKSLMLKNLNFTKADFTNYEKIKLIIFKDNFIKNNKEPSVFNFDFINYAYKIGGKNGIKIAKQNIINWQIKNRFKHNKLWSSESIASRIINIIYNYDFINSLSKPNDEKILIKIIIYHIRRLNFSLNLKTKKNLSLLELKAYILINIITNKKNVNYEKIFSIIIINQLDQMSMHKSYDVLEHTKFVNHINEIISICLRFNVDLPIIFFITKLKMITILSQYFHKDKSIALFNGANNKYLNEILKVIKEENNIRKIEFLENHNGVFFYEDKNKKIFLDVVQPSKSFLSNKLSASTLSFEFSSGDEKIITNCGAIERLGKNASYLRYTAAHSALILENTNISEIRENQTHLKFPQIVDFKYNKSKEMRICEASHNGYIKNYNKIIKRKISFKNIDESIFGEDQIISSISKNKQVVFHIRFHIMPDISIIETNSKKSIILRTKRNNIWTFRCNLHLSLEESIYANNSNTAKTNQIVITGVTKNNKELIKWSLIKT